MDSAFGDLFRVIFKPSTVSQRVSQLNLIHLCSYHKIRERVMVV